MIKLSKYNPEQLLSCIAYCGKIDRIISDHQYKSSPSDRTLQLNAGYGKVADADDRDAQIARGTLEWLREFHDHTDSFSLSNTSIKTMHRKIFKHSPRDDGTRGRFRTDLENEIKQLTEELKIDLSSGERHPLFMISLFRISFMEMMPFITGNTYCANLLSYALLIQNGYGHISQLTLLASLNNDNSPTPQHHVGFLAKTLYREMLNYSSKQKMSSDAKTYLNPRRKKLLEIIREKAPLKISDIMAGFSDESRNTIKKDLLYLRDKEMILANGTGRGTYYTIVG
jgi:hypothetical protein